MENLTQFCPWPHADDIELEPCFPEQTLLAYPESFELELDYFDPEMQEDKLWKARTGLNEDSLSGAIETIVFMSDKPVSLQKIRATIDEDMPLKVIHAAIERLQSEYENKHHGIRLQEVAEGYQFRTKATYGKFVQDLFKVNGLVLSPTALEVMAILAYRQPVSKTDIDKIRGVDSSHIVRGLMDKRLVKVVGRSEELGRPVLYGTTSEFLEVFNLADITGLPPESELEEQSMQSVGKIADIKTLVHSGDKARFSFDEVGELDELAESIRAISSDTSFTQSLKDEEKRKTNSDSEAAPKKSAFDLLEDYVNKRQIEDVNRASGLSELFTAVTLPQVINDLTAGPFNIPEDDEDEDFQMIDLETGEAIEVEVELEEDDANAEFVQLFGDDNLEQEAQDLSDALDQAFERLTGSSLETDELALRDDKVEDNERKIDNLTDDMVEKASDLDIDLSFLKDQNQDTDSLN
ncbi:MAG: SMC-Scp complex subunit ScpB [Halobacteriovorax sp.]|nr:SMC-Scp complex subunit ScpB [Halobacteriovorax sp.]|tara:strand:- start:121 stop:1515 length:1395 start_codon:yes stop_codon:yes gene_type:complete